MKETVAAQDAVGVSASRAAMAEAVAAETTIGASAFEAATTWTAVAAMTGATGEYGSDSVTDTSEMAVMCLCMISVASGWRRRDERGRRGTAQVMPL
ncbi:hypothetical protein ACU635_51725 [[Actinomadura] parvosata]|uniref:hypothetical protein n=1 Tax=[Actinomadura] parvosata TaxID=1955412 RepID=UPI00406C05E0